mgnify:FL=1
MLRVALTGGIGSGKSEAGAIFANLGAIVVDSDVLAREVIERGSTGFDEVVSAFGDQILNNGEIDRAKLASIVFEDESKRKTLENIIHPKIREKFEDIARNANSSDILINLIPLLVETNGAKNFDRVIAISAPVDIRKQRLLNRGMKEHEISKRLDSQVSDTEREKVADFVLINSGTLGELQSEVETLYEKLKTYASNQ